ncbi:isocitrate lyase/PEP mutase family protein [Amycolatopsis regifaucium]|uniref:Carboxyvinyl-carboxyphosphonate phosphorylmutase n=1 Tax=Amycolatopsis regifaucium TaxID=546365 RepID=A0A154MIA9_9PSEU|nr:isocitrate lyase/phosphoenolpyruvate mutase family protein [Amycolatopsis regifaucium]KZB83727.1 carboxyvinyl-carboxyphosphonate phosphorylmutase [Amycolatopsis regifaucium]OKA06832.1 carboxyvinyl-carboxyphosphonate phosphorylmutase [Amycolatopsis regifaucium]SFH27682.1 2-Methylisocitrate lyase, PEP mutase family [Amycolatopsis regifaucium]
MTAARLRELHVAGTPLLLPNAWDADSARLVEAAGFPVVATSSFAIAKTLGYDDGEAAPVKEMFAAAARIARAVSVPVTVDVEAGYGLEAGDLAARLAEAGAVGCNYEDTDYVAGGLRSLERQAEQIAKLREAAGDALVINARVDVFVGASDERAVLDDAIVRAKAYFEAGADCVYPILAKTPEVLGDFVKAVAPGAVNAMPLPGGPDLSALATLGVARISLGTGLWKSVRADLRAKLTELTAGKLPY